MFFFFVSMALSPSSSLRFFPMVTTIWSAASTLQRRSWLRFTRPCLTTTSTWRVPCSSPTWSLPDTPAPTNTATRRLPWPPLPPCAAPCLLQSLVRWLHAVMQTLQTQSCVYPVLCPIKCWDEAIMFSPHRHYFPVWRSEWGGGLHQPERHEPVPSAQALGLDLLLWPCPAGFCP